MDFNSLSKSQTDIFQEMSFCYEKCNNDTFWNLETNAAKIRHCCEIVEKNNLLSRATVMKKSERKSSELRQEGNQHFVGRKDYIAALEAYNEALCFAPIGSESVGLVYANRSAIYLETGFYGFCLENIKLALDHKYPERLRPKLLQRKETCMEKMKTEMDSFEVYKNRTMPKLSYPANPKNPSIADCLQCVKDEKFGRHIVTNRDLKPGDIVLVEEPFVSVDSSNNSNHVCYNCEEHNFYNLQPCPKSTKVMFCSEKCANEAWERHYQFEWPVIDELFYWTLSMTALRTTMKAFTMMKHPSELKEFIKSIDIDADNAFNLDWTQADERDKFRVAYGLCSNKGKLSASLGFGMVTLCAITFSLIKDVPSFKDMLPTPEIENLFLELLIHFEMIVNNNWFAKNSFIDRDNETTGTGSVAIGLTRSLINHSCISNVRDFVLSDKPSIIVSRPIKAGQQLFLTYRDFSYEKKSLEERKYQLKSLYVFDCNCQACTENFPQDVPCKRFLNSRKLFELAAFWKAPDDEITQETAQKVKDFASKMLIQNDRHNPCQELSLLKQCLRRAMIVLADEKGLPEMLLAKK